MKNIAYELQAHPDWAAVQIIYHRLQGQGYKAFLAGGCVRDALLGVKANDLDVATDASPDQIEALFEKTVNVGKSFGVMRVLEGGADIEVATFRTDGPYLDGRRPEGVHFSSPQEDAQRRDFTVNALFFDLHGGRILDFVGGVDDLQNKVLRTVGDPQKRFTEDHLRLLRAARFVSQLNFELEFQTFEALKRMSYLVTSVSGERIRDEMNKLLKTTNPQAGLQVMVDSGLMKELFAFRQGDGSWGGDFGAEFAWQRLVLFLRQAPVDSLPKILATLKLSAQESKAIERSLSLLRDPESFFQQRMGEKLILASKEGVVWALHVLANEGSSAKQSAIKVLQEWGRWQKNLPAPFLSGDDVKTQLNGKAIGECLHGAYVEQLEGRLLNREDALEWLKGYLESGLKND